ncbi:MAG: nucleoside recognition protein [Fibrobacteres bacterium]|nr:nucleoside recognition protein [Fibrobacterota bacterium]
MTAAIQTGIKKGFRAGIDLLKVMVPISFIVELLNWFGVLPIISSLLEPLFSLFGLPGSAALAFVTGALLNCYSAIAIMITIGLDGRETTILALMVLICHNLPVEAAVQKKCGSSATFIVFYRIGSAFLAAFILNLLMPVSAAAEISKAAVDSTDKATLLATVTSWAIRQAPFLLKIMAIIIALMIFNSLMERYGGDKVLIKVLSPILKPLGLPTSTAFLWIIANTLGLAYGSSIILAHRAENRLSLDDIRILNVSIATCHSLLEDTLLFVAIGAAFFWITIPRVIIAMAAVWIYRAVITKPADSN